MSPTKIFLLAILTILAVNQVTCPPGLVDRFVSVIKESNNKFDTNMSHFIVNQCRISSYDNQVNGRWLDFLESYCNVMDDCLYGVLYNNNNNVDSNYIIEETYSTDSNQYSRKAYKAYALGASRSNSKFKFYVIWDIEIDENYVLIYKMKHFTSRDQAIRFNDSINSEYKFLYDSTVPTANRFDSLNIPYKSTIINLKEAFYTFTDGDDAGTSSFPSFSLVSIPKF